MRGEPLGQVGDLPDLYRHYRLDADATASRARGRDDGHRIVGLVAAHGDRVERDQTPDLGGDRLEHLLRPRRLGHQCRHPAQGGLLLGNFPQLHPGLGVGDRGCH